MAIVIPRSFSSGALSIRSKARDGRRQRRLAVVNVPNRSYIRVWLASVEFLLAHNPLSLYYI
jgi:hypothetical protein